MKYKIRILMYGVILLFTGCVTKMPLEANKKSLSNPAKPIAIFKLRTENVYRPSYQPRLCNFIVESLDTKSQTTVGDRNGVKPYKYEEDKYYEYLVSLEASPGNYTLTRVHGIVCHILITGGFSFPVNARFSLTNGVIYLGHMTITNRERKEGEEPSGGLFPLIDQAVSGMRDSTFDITISDQSETDIPDFIKAYPALQGVTISKSIMQR